MGPRKVRGDSRLGLNTKNKVTKDLNIALNLGVRVTWVKSLEIIMSDDTKILEDIGEYKYGFHDRDDNYTFKSQKGLSREVVENISRMKGEPEWMLEFRLKALDHFPEAPNAELGTLPERAQFRRDLLLR